ncbi:GPCR, family 2-like protein [Cordyceps fumosorosea ARSEF 2679]|uniref:GPCR, family 2-like protein n=1 Tax=Cordyceps fumosorosea (strain ARSEF 2679) TaxID=1081104 RepID=A0A167YCM6_CORFA|nr:GPCR, family 2-like protein [Cordyceps fumosorosea ARSEF 2679]OAA66169.1 GPCR, family 2-like protein [Cordyceps fumosorosea ARSEF 2679]
MPATLTAGQLDAISIIERACSVFSLLGCLFTIVTFCSSSAFHKPINRLVFYASFGNMMTNVGTLMSRSYLTDILSAGCQFQAFLIQMFMPADAFWTLAMAVNVYLTFYYKFDAVALRRMEIPYLVLCYGVPLIPAFVFIFVENQHGVRVYGNALLWCWISSDWDIWRIAAFYGPVWVVIIITFFVYIRAGRTIYEKRKQLRDFHSSTDPDPLSVNGDAHYSVRTTEVTITSEAINTADGAPAPFGRHTAISAQPPKPSPEDNRAYSIHVTSHSIGSVHSAEDVELPLQGRDEPPKPSLPTTTPQPISSFTTRPQPPPRVPRVPNPHRRRNHELNNAAWSYTKCSILFFTVILITWIPSSANRVYSVIHKNEISIVLEFMSAFVLPLQGFWNAVIYATTSWAACKNFFQDLRYRNRPDITELVDGPSTSGARGGHSEYPASSFPTAGAQKSRFGAGGGFLGASSKPTPAKPFDSESATELSTTRTNSADGQRN